MSSWSPCDNPYCNDLIITSNVFILIFPLSATPWEQCRTYVSAYLEHSDSMLTSHLSSPASWSFFLLRCWKASRLWTIAFCWESTSWTIPSKRKKKRPHKMCLMLSGLWCRRSSTQQQWNPSRVQGNLETESSQRTQTRTYGHLPTHPLGRGIPYHWVMKCNHAPFVVALWEQITSIHHRFKTTTTMVGCWMGREGIYFYFE